MQDGTSSDAYDAVHASDASQNNESDAKFAVNGIHSDPSYHARSNDENQTPNGRDDLRTPPASPHGTKRKLSEIKSNRSRRTSPPWKAFSADGPTSFTAEDGRRKSGRRNAVPLELQPQGAKRQTRREYNKYQGDLSKSKRNSHPHDGPSGHKSKDVGAYRKSAFDGGTPNQSHVHFEDSSLPPMNKTRSHRTSSSENITISTTQRKSPRTNAGTVHRRGTRLASKQVAEHSSESRGQKFDDASERTSSRTTRIMLRLSPRSLPILNPGNIPPTRKYGSLGDLLHHDDPLDGLDDHRFTEKEASREAAIRHELVSATKQGGVLSTSAPMFEQDQIEDEPHIGYAHHDYLAKHVEDLQQRIMREGRDHRALAKKLAQAAAAAVRAKMPKTAEELEAEMRAKTKEKLRSVLKQLKSYLDMASQKVMEIKRDEYYAREAAQGREQMKEWVDRSEGLLNARTAHHSLEGRDSVQDSHANSSETNTSTDDEESDGDSNSSSSADEDESGENSDQDLTAEQLHDKYKNVLGQQADLDHESEVQSTNGGGSSVNSYSEARVGDQEEELSDEHLVAGSPTAEDLPDLEVVDEVMLDNEDTDSNTSGTPTEDSERGVATDDEGSDDEEDASTQHSEDVSEDEKGNDLLGFFSSADLGKLEKSSIEATANTDADAGSEETKRHTVNGYRKSDEASAGDQDMRTPSPTLSKDVTAMKDDPSTLQKDIKDNQESSPNKEFQLRESSQDPSGERILSQNTLDYSYQTNATSIPVSDLVRGQLRPYQHGGFEWLAGMYENSTNGILADEMGLGKTFQTIALLAHLATHYHIWGPHLIVVPTSVILNWEIEFKKFLPGFKVLPYYGSQHERQEKRKGWNDLDKWNVCITSYQLAISDQTVLKRRPWHYLILDEAHNIKNYKSQRWQTLLSFKSQARLLLTGTPLQNNLAELWSLLFFLAPEQDEKGKTSFGDLTEFSKVFHRPVDQILEHGRGALDEEAMMIVSKLHQVLRPHLLRRLKADVETQMPKKYEHVTVCRLSKRQRQLYDGYMGLAGTRESFASGNYMSIINSLMQLRKVCNHPDLFETRQIVTSFAMQKSAVAGYEIKELLMRRELLSDIEQTTGLEVCNLWRSNNSTFADANSRLLSAESKFTAILNQQNSNADHKDALFDISSTLANVRRRVREAQSLRLSSIRTRNKDRIGLKPVYSKSFLDQLHLHMRLSLYTSLRPSSEDFLNTSSVLRDSVLDLNRRSDLLRPIVQRFACTTPNVIAPAMSQQVLTSVGSNFVSGSFDSRRPDPFHEARIRLSIAFPDKSLIQYDCGKLQRLDNLLRQLQSGGHRAVIFTQMTKVLDILEQFMNLHGHRYLRLDGATKIEQRQIITERFNSDTRILAFICSSRSGGLGINLTGADTVIFYDLDWNPAMDKQCQDRCHRIGQTRDVHIYRFVCEGTIEANILRKSNQKRMLDDVVIQEGDFTTESFNKLGTSDGDQDTDAAIDKVFGGGGSRMLQQAEDKEDRDAAKEAQREDLQADDADFGEKPVGRPTDPATSQTTTPAPDSTDRGNEDSMMLDAPPPSIPTDDQDKPNLDNLDQGAREQLFERFTSVPFSQDKPYFRDVDEDGNACPGGSDDYLIRLMSHELRHVVWVPPKSAKDKKKKKKGPEFGIIRR